MSRCKTMYYNRLYTEIETEVDIEAPPSAVWRVFADFASWDTWTSGFMRFLEPPTAPGKRCGLVCKLSQGALKTTTHWPMVEVFDEGRELMWRDYSLLMSPFWQGCHWFRFEPLPGGRTRLLHGTRQMGLAMPALWDAMKSTELGYHAFNDELRTEVERRCTAGAPHDARSAERAAAGAPAPLRLAAGALAPAASPGKLLAKADGGGVETRTMAASRRQAGSTLITAGDAMQ
ncbi:hypothetical protein Rsub_02987 [Raphidocelis subcapitata]|uniref:Coenzyme Q-binding protein COQ10 START domain-containing protein n=1 Tax=Raphidocelis subcapitata TaxID=307507 RepID=A0A2V0P0H6_9CHLO|nr:hypothetical protein Rsub_02987 [Raphidocelis subcapitata]|eukprot:GBF90687.1 hypothetical protein Rsub_02987 [Raphidocelis subcapitata]